MASVTNHFDWDNPDYSLLSNRRGKLPAFPVEHFSPGFTKWLARASRGAGCSADHLAVLSIGVCSSLIGKARQIQASTSWIEPTTSWCAVIGESGERKTAGQRAIMRTKKIELENRPVYQDANAKHQQRVEKARLATAKWKRDVAQAITEKKNDLPKMPDEAIDPGSFIWPSLAVSDCTHQRLARLCNVRPRGMLMVRSELSGFFANMRAAGARGFFLESWDGGRYVVERVADEKCITVENLLVGIVGGLQPSKISRAFAGDEDGMYARFLFGWPESPEFQELSNDIEVVDPFFQSLLTKLIRLPEDKEKILALSPAAQQEFENYRRFVDHTKRGLSGRELHWLSKSETHVLRLCNTLAYLDWAEKAPSAGLESFLPYWSRIRSRRNS